MKEILIASLLGLGASCESKEAKPDADCVARIDPNCMCTKQYDPVCGCDGKTYGNACEAGCANIRVVSKGECPGK